MSSKPIAPTSSASPTPNGVEALARACERLNLEQLLQRMAVGDETSLAEFHKLMADRLYSMALRMLEDHGAAAEALQDVLVRVWNSAGRFDAGRGDAFTWVAMLLRGICLDLLRSRSRRIRRTEKAAQLLPSEAPGELEDLFFRETVQLVRHALDSLELAEREVLETALFSPESAAEAAVRLSLTPGNLKVRTHRAMQRLRSLLGERLPHPR